MCPEKFLKIALYFSEKRVQNLIRPDITGYRVFTKILLEVLDLERCRHFVTSPLLLGHVEHPLKLVASLYYPAKKQRDFLFHS